MDWEESDPEGGEPSCPFDEWWPPGGPDARFDLDLIEVREDWMPRPFSEEMLRFSPESVKALGTVGWGIDYLGLDIDPARVEEVVAANEAAGYRCTKDQDLIDRATAYRNHEEGLYPSCLPPSEESPE